MMLLTSESESLMACCRGAVRIWIRLVIVSLLCSPSLGGAEEFSIGDLFQQIGPAMQAMQEHNNQLDQLDKMSSQPPINQAVPERIQQHYLPQPDGSMQLPVTPPIDHGKVEVIDGMVSVNARDASLKTVLSALAKAQKLNLVCSSDDDAYVTVSLDRVPMEKALNTIVAIAGYTWTMEDGIILVSPASATTRVAPNVQGRQVRVIELDFASAEDVNLAISGLLSPVGQSFISVSNPADNRRTKEMIVVEDLPQYLCRIENYVAQVDVPPRQVAIHAHILEVDLGDDCRHGVNLGHLSSVLDPRLRVQTQGFAGSPTQAFLLQLDTLELNGLIEAIKTTTDAKTLASPRIHAVNGQESRIQIGQQLGFRVTTVTETSSLESVNFIDVGVVLRVTPRISRDGRVLMRVKPEVSSGAINAQTGLPEEETTELETDCLLSSGEGIIVGGLIKEELSNVQGKVPGLGDVPYVGGLFQRRQVNKTRSEIIIALIPHILPHAPELHARHQSELERATTPLVYGPLCEVPRPYEAELPDSVRDGNRMLQTKLHDWHQRKAAQQHDAAACQTGCANGRVVIPIEQRPPVHYRNAPQQMHNLPAEESPYHIQPTGYYDQQKPSNPTGFRRPTGVSARSYRSRR